jgi:hypothetical protein
MNTPSNAFFLRALSTLAILFFLALAMPQAAHAHSGFADVVSADKASTVSNGREGVWLFEHCDDGPTCSGAKSLLHVDRQPTRVCVSYTNFDLKLSAYRSPDLGRDPPVPISTL